MSVTAILSFCYNKMLVIQTEEILMSLEEWEWDERQKKKWLTFKF